MKYFFILGRNPELSRAELFIYFESRGIFFEEVIFSENLLILNFKLEVKINIQMLGGTLGLGKLHEFKNKVEFLDYLGNEEFVELDKFTYTIFGNLDSYYLSEKFKKDRKKAQIKNFGKKLRLQSGENTFIPNVDVEIFAFNKGSHIFLGIVEQRFSSKDVESRDMKKPIRRESLAISPRLARILINLSGAREGDSILDPFCGVGGIIQEAVIMEINCLGIDIDSEAITGAKINLNWLKNNYKFKSKYEFIQSNSLSAPNRQYSSIVAESSLGEVLRKKLARKSAKKYLNEFTEKIIPLLKKFKEIKGPKAKIAITFPCFEDVQITAEEIIPLSGLRLYSNGLVKFPIIEKRNDQFVNRQIWVFY
jgi:tRNA G10  N-methylase Trm11